MKQVWVGVNAGKTNLRVAVFGRSEEMLARWAIEVADLPMAPAVPSKELRGLRARHTVSA